MAKAWYTQPIVVCIWQHHILFSNTHFDIRQNQIKFIQCIYHPVQSMKMHSIWLFYSKAFPPGGILSIVMSPEHLVWLPRRLFTGSNTQWQERRQREKSFHIAISLAICQYERGKPGVLAHCCLATRPAHQILPANGPVRDCGLPLTPAALICQDDSGKAALMDPYEDTAQLPPPCSSQYVSVWKASDGQPHLLYVCHFH